MKKIILVITSLVAILAFAQPALATLNVTPAKLAATLQSQKINLNTAGVKEIASVLTGVGMKKAQAIVNYRNTHGQFETIEELASVKGIGVATIAKNEERIILK